LQDHAQFNAGKLLPLVSLASRTCNSRSINDTKALRPEICYFVCFSWHTIWPTLSQLAHNIIEIWLVGAKPCCWKYYIPLCNQKWHVFSIFILIVLCFLIIHYVLQLHLKLVDSPKNNWRCSPQKLYDYILYPKDKNMCKEPRTRSIVFISKNKLVTCIHLKTIWW
jgi:hypothetical protein